MKYRGKNFVSIIMFKKMFKKSDNLLKFATFLVKTVKSNSDPNKFLIRVKVVFNKKGKKLTSRKKHDATAVEPKKKKKSW